MHALLLLVFTTAGLLAQADNWNLLRGIYVGQTVHVHMLDGHLNSGGFLSTSDAGIVIRLRAGDQTFTKDQIKKVSVRNAGKRARNAGIGAAVAAAAIARPAASIIGEQSPAAYVAAVAATALIGAGIGALIPGYDTIYRVPRK